MGRHGRRELFSDVAKNRVVTVVVGASSVAMLAAGWVHRSDRYASLLWFGMGVFFAGSAVIVGSLSLGPRPLKSFGVGAWLLVMGSGAAAVWFGRDALDPTNFRSVLLPPVMALVALGLPPLGLWMMIKRPEQRWEKEMRAANRPRD